MREIILNFHGIGVPPPAADSAERIFWWDEASFVSALNDLPAVSRNGASVRITFDDGNMSDVAIALPALAKRGMTAWFFVCAGRIGMPGYLDNMAIRDLLSAGMSVGSHGMHHRDWRKLNDVELEVETADARRRLQDVCGRGIDEVSVPFGSYDRRVLAKLRLEGYRRVYTSDGGAVKPGMWLTARNTLDHSWQGKNVLEELAAHDTIARRFRRAIVTQCKALR
jgi:peptidoglycan/xylan/chitin deacetylase (PgdA/CDA1 family)